MALESVKSRESAVAPSGAASCGVAPRSSGVNRIWHLAACATCSLAALAITNYKWLQVASASPQDSIERAKWIKRHRGRVAPCPACETVIAVFAKAPCGTRTRHKLAPRAGRGGAVSSSLARMQSTGTCTSAAAAPAPVGSSGAPAACGTASTRAAAPACVGFICADEGESDAPSGAQRAPMISLEPLLRTKAARRAEPARHGTP